MVCVLCLHHHHHHLILSFSLLSHTSSSPQHYRSPNICVEMCICFFVFFVGLLLTPEFAPKMQEDDHSNEDKTHNEHNRGGPRGDTDKQTNRQRERESPVKRGGGMRQEIKARSTFAKEEETRTYT